MSFSRYTMVFSIIVVCRGGSTFPFVLEIVIIVGKPAQPSSIGLLETGLGNRDLYSRRRSPIALKYSIIIDDSVCNLLI